MTCIIKPRIPACRSVASIGGWIVLVTLFAVGSSFASADDARVIDEAEITSSDREHWAFRPLTRPNLPEIEDEGSSRNPIDRFVLARLDQKNLRMSPAADRVTLARRLFFDVIGLPPTTEEIDKFQKDRSPDAYDHLVDRLLASSHYGERWGQHWLDLARFAETDGFEHDKIRPTAWKYRDWVIRALNDDMPYDQFIQWQIAGDVLKPDVKDAHIATAFCVAGPDMPDINSQKERKHTLLNELTSTVGSVVLGLQFGCAQCHDHMYDPISQADFYRLRAFFQPAVNVKKNKSITMLDSSTSPEKSYFMVRGDWRRRGPEVNAAYPRIANPARDVVRGEDTGDRRAELARWITRGDHPLTARVIVNRVWQFHFGQGLSNTPSDFGVMGDSPSHPKLLDWLACELVESGWRLKELHRLILESDTYRQRSFVAKVADLVNQWEAAEAVDPGGRLYWKFPRRRLEAEIVRDAMYHVSGSLNLKAGGPGVRPPLPREMISTLLKNQWTTSENKEDHYRRSIYVFARRNLRYPLFAAFDRPAANSSCAVRQTTTTAPQALLMMNSQVSLDAARRLAGLVLDRAGNVPRRQVDEAFRRALARPPSNEERAELVAFLTRQSLSLEREQRAGDPLATPVAAGEIGGSTAAAALTDLCLALLNSNEFIYLD